MQFRCPLCKGCFPLDLTDRDLPPIKRVEANYWKTNYCEMLQEVVKANKGIRRLHRKANKSLHLTPSSPRKGHEPNGRK